MYALKNRVQLIGNVGQKPEIKISARGIKSARFVLAINESYKNSRGERVRDTQWHSISVSGRLAEIADKFLEKGMEIAVEGRLVNRSYQDKDGNKRSVTEIQVNEILLLGNRDIMVLEEPAAIYKKNSKQADILAEIVFNPTYSIKSFLVADFN